jgi:hypothetical protein
VIVFECTYRLGSFKDSGDEEDLAGKSEKTAKVAERKGRGQDLRQSVDYQDE